MTKRTYDPNLDNVYVRTPKGSPTSEILWDGETIEQWNRERNRKPGPPEELLSQWRESKTGAA